MCWLRLLSLLVLVAASPPLRAQDRTILPLEQPPFAGTLDPLPERSRQGGYVRHLAPANAPNVLLFMSDDVGFGMAGTFGGPVPTPNFDRIAKQGVRYNQFHTTGICSPTRAALLTGRNHHNVSFGYLSDLPMDYPGYRAEFPTSAVSLPEILRLNGYNTAMFGKWHNTRSEYVSTAGPFDQWPTGQGFEYFYGLIGGDSDQFRPALYRNTVRVADLSVGAPVLEKRLADDAIDWLHNQQAVAPNKPFLIYLAPASTHAPHQAPAEFIARFRGQFDQGWDRLREESFARMLASGMVPPGTVLTERPAEIPAWSSLTPEMKAWHARAMEVAAGMLAYQDAQLGRVIDELERTGEAKNLLTVLILGDNGASAESGVDGGLNELAKINGIANTPEQLHAAIPALGGAHHYPAFGAGWAWAMNTPLRWAKQYASMLGGIRNGMIMKWSRGVTGPGSVCPQFGHVIDIAPTVLDAAGLPAPVKVRGVEQKPLDGVSLLSSLQTCNPALPRTQYFEMGGKLGLWHNGWFAARDDGRIPWQLSASPEAARDWELYDLTQDFSQSRNVANANQARLQEMIGLFDKAARANNVYPLFNNFGPGRAPRGETVPLRFDYYGNEVSVPFAAGPRFTGRSFRITVELEDVSGSGPVVAYGSWFSGWALHMKRGRPAFTYAFSTDPAEIYSVPARRALRRGEQLALEFVSEGVRKPATVRLFAGEEMIGEGRIAKTFLSPAGLGETLDVGRDRGVAVTRYATREATFSGTIRHVGIALQSATHPAGAGH